MIPVEDTLVTAVDIDNDKDSSYLKDEIRFLRNKNVIESLLKKSENVYNTIISQKGNDYLFFKKLCVNYEQAEYKLKEYKKNL